MPGITNNWLTTRVARGPGRIYAHLGGASDHIWDGAAGVRLLLHTDGSPNSTQNPNAVHLGMTEGGTEFSVKPTVQDFFADEFPNPIISTVTAEEALISGSLLQVTDMAVQAIMNPTGTRSDVGGSEGLTFGGAGVLAYTSVAVVFPVEGSTTLFSVFHLYKAYNDQGIAAQISSKKLGASPFAFKGQAITTRATGDQVGRLYRQVSGGS
jgi:hypothetical protein